MGNVRDSVRTVSTAQAISWDDHKSRTISRSITWNDKKVRPVGAALIVALGGVMWAGAANAALHHASHTVSVVVRAKRLAGRKQGGQLRVPVREIFRFERREFGPWFSG